MRPMFTFFGLRNSAIIEKLVLYENTTVNEPCIILVICISNGSNIISIGEHSATERLTVVLKITTADPATKHGG